MPIIRMLSRALLSFSLTIRLTIVKTGKMYMNSRKRGSTPETTCENGSNCCISASSGTAIKLIVAALTPVAYFSTMFAIIF